MKYYLILFVLYMASFSGSAQVIIKEDSEVTRIMENFLRSNTSPEKTVYGWRVQISATVDRRQIESMKKQFQQDFPEFGLTTVYDNPYYKLRAGAFTEKNKAENALNSIKTKYRSSYLTRDVIKMGELGKED